MGRGWGKRKRENERESVSESLCAHRGTLHTSPGGSGGSDHVEFLQARLRRQGRDKEGSSALRDSLEKSSLSLPFRQILSSFGELSMHPASSKGPRRSSVLTARGCPCPRTQAASEGKNTCLPTKENWFPS